MRSEIGWKVLTQNNTTVLFDADPDRSAIIFSYSTTGACLIKPDDVPVNVLDGFPFFNGNFLVIRGSLARRGWTAREIQNSGNTIMGWVHEFEDKDSGIRVRADQSLPPRTDSPSIPADG